jgi:3-hydroxyacyl-CoA dehydrogenase
MATTDLVIEAVFEDLKVKHAVIADLEAVVAKDAVIATNTSALPIRDVARGARHPERILGMHYFSPVDKMPLLEIITHEGTSKEAVAKAFRLGSAQGKTVIVVKDVPGFYVNRCLGPYMAEGMALLAAGVDPLAIDRALKSFGFPVGPITLIDEVGVDVASHVNSFLSKDLGVRMAGSEAGLSLLASMLEQDLKGRKSGEGFFVYGKGGGKGGKELSERTTALLPSEKVDMDEETIVDRMILRFVNEAALCVQEGIVASETDADIGAVFGIGFPPQLGGPLRYARETLGFAETVRRMEKYRSQLGEQFAPCDYLVRAAKK